MDVEFQQELENKRHDELLSVLSTIAAKMESNSDNSQLYSLLISEMRKITSTLEKTSKTDNTTEEIKKLSSVWVKAVDKLKPPTSSEWTFDIKRDDRGYIASVDAIKIQ